MATVTCAGIQTLPVESLSCFVTPAMASAWRANCRYDGQRPVRPWHVSNLAKMMREGKFRPKTQIAFVRFGEDYFLTNGQHTLAAIELSATTQELSIVVSNASSMEEVADDFARHDTHLTRRFGDSLVAHSVHEELGISPTTLNLATAAVIYYAYLVGEVAKRGVQLTHDDKLMLVRRHGHLAVKSLGYFDGHTSVSYLTRKTTVASAMLCTSAKPDAAEQFFMTLAADDGLRQGDPRKTLLEWLKLRRTPGGAWARNTPAPTASDQELVKGISLAWNAWIDGKDLKFIRVNFDSPIAEFRQVGTVTVRK